jgi:hypothetical protein
VSNNDKLEDLARRLALATLLLHKGGKWSLEDHEKWGLYTGSVLVTIKSINELAMKVLSITAVNENVKEIDKEQN